MKGLVSDFLRVWTLVDAQTRWQGVGVGTLIIVMTLLEAIGIGLIFPFIKLVTEPALLKTESWANPISKLAPNTSDTELLAYMALILAGVFALKNLVTLCVQFSLAMFNSKNEAALATKLFSRYLMGDYALHLNRNSSEFIRNITGSASTVFTSVVFGAITMLAELLIVTVLAVILFFVSPKLTVFAILALGVLGSIFYLMTRNRLAALGRSIQVLTGDELKILQQGLHSLKEIRVLGRESSIITEFWKKKQSLARRQALQATFLFAPRSWIETTMVGGMLAVVAILLLDNVSASDIFSTLALFGAAAFRMLPSANRIVIAMSSMKNGMYAVNLVYADMVTFARSSAINAKRVQPVDQNFRKIEFLNVAYRYPTADTDALLGITFELERGQSLGIVGPSGAGKTTLVDVFLGLFDPSRGQVRIDGEPVKPGARAWQDLIGYVPQSIYIFDNSVRQNVAFGLVDSEIDDAKVRRALRLAHLLDLVEALPEKLDTHLGEHGMRLSGGQRQRIGIARALYHDPPILVLDEATSSLDNETERGINQAVRDLSGDKTIIIIAHRLSTVRSCEKLIFLQGGRISAQGTFEEMIASNDDFKNLVEISKY